MAKIDGELLISIVEASNLVKMGSDVPDPYCVVNINKLSIDNKPNFKTK